MTPAEEAAVRAVLDQRAQQGLEESVTDPIALRRIAEILVKTSARTETRAA